MLFQVTLLQGISQGGKFTEANPQRTPRQIPREMSRRVLFAPSHKPKMATFIKFIKTFASVASMDATPMYLPVFGGQDQLCFPQVTLETHPYLLLEESVCETCIFHQNYGEKTIHH